MEVESHEEASEQVRATFESERAEKEALEQARTRRWRFRVVSMVLPALLGSLAFLGVNLIDTEYLHFELGLPREIVALAIIGLFGWSGFNTVMVYLQTGFKYENLSELTSTRYEYEVKIQEAEVDLRRSFSELSNRLSDLETRIEEGNLSDHDILGSERDTLLNRLRESIEKTATTEFLNKIRSSIEKSRVGLELTGELQDRYRSTIDRLKMELSALTLRGNLNLSIGIITAITGMALLAIYLWDTPPSISTEDASSSEGASPLSRSASTLVNKFVPRLSLVIFIEVFAYFFLRLYSASLTEIKYFQNEITNVEAKFLALRAAMHSGDKRSVESVISQLAKTERNYILQKGQTTVDLERSRAEKEAITSLTRNWLKALPRRPWS